MLLRRLQPDPGLGSPRHEPVLVRVPDHVPRRRLLEDDVDPRSDGRVDLLHQLHRVAGVILRREEIGMHPAVVLHRRVDLGVLDLALLETSMMPSDLIPQRPRLDVDTLAEPGRRPLLRVVEQLQIRVEDARQTSEEVLGRLGEVSGARLGPRRGRLVAEVGAVVATTTSRRAVLTGRRRRRRRRRCLGEADALATDGRLALALGRGLLLRGRLLGSRGLGLGRCLAAGWSLGDGSRLWGGRRGGGAAASLALGWSLVGVGGRRLASSAWGHGDEQKGCRAGGQKKKMEGVERWDGSR